MQNLNVTSTSHLSQRDGAQSCNKRAFKQKPSFSKETFISVSIDIGYWEDQCKLSWKLWICVTYFVYKTCMVDVRLIFDQHSKNVWSVWLTILEGWKLYI